MSKSITNQGRATEGNTWGYVRLSQHDLEDQTTTLEQKYTYRRAICLELAQKHKLPLRPENILCEQKSGGYLDSRPEMLSLLARAERGTLRHLVTPYQDRLLRGDKGDEHRIESTLVNSGVTLYTTEEVTDFGDEERDPLTFEMRAMIARHYRNEYIKKRRTTDRARMSENVRSQGAPPWCYHRTGKSSYGVYPERFAVAQEIFARAWSDSLNSITRDLNARRVPSPYSYRWTLDTLRRLCRESDARLAEVCAELNAAVVHSEAVPHTGWTPERLRALVQAGTEGDENHQVAQRHFCRACIAAGLLTPYPMVWKAQTIREMLRNPFFAGRVSRRKKVPGGRRKAVRLNWDAYTIAPTDGDWPRVLSFEDRRKLMHQMGDIKPTGRAPRSGLVTGILHCPNGQPMCLDGAPAYACPCQYTREPHDGMETRRFRWENYARDVVLDVLESLPQDALTWASEPQADKTDQAETRRQYAQACDLSVQARGRMESLMIHRAENVANFGQEMYDQVAARVRAEVEAALREEKRLGALLSRPNLRAVRPLLAAVREAGAAALWESAEFDLRRAAVEGVIARLELVPLRGGQRCYSNVRVVYQDWVTEWLPNHQPPPVRGKKWGERWKSSDANSGE